MNTRQIKAGTTDVSVVIRIVDSADGTPETGVVYNSAGIDLQYRREGATSTAITEATLAALTTAHADGGFLHIGNGYYRLDLPDAACAAGVTGVLVHGTVTGMVVIGCYIQLVAYDPYDTVRLGLTALPNVASGSAGAVITSGTGTAQLSVSGGVGNANVTAIADAVITAAKIATDAITAAKIATDAITEIQSGLATAAGVSAVETDTQDIQSRLPAALVTGRMSSDAVAISGSTAAADAVEANIGNLDASVAARPTTAQVNAEVDTALADYDGPTYAELLNLVRLAFRKDAALATDLSALIATINADLGSGGGVFASTTDSQEAIRDRGDAAWITAAGFSTLDAADVRTAVGLASANLDTQLGAIVADTGTDGVVISAATANQIADAILKRDWTSVSGEAARSALNALRFLRNGFSIAGTTLTVLKEDDATEAFTRTLTTDAAADPITGVS